MELTDLKAVTIAIFVYYLTKWLDRYLSKRKLNKVQEQLDLKSDELLLLETLDDSNKQLIIFGLKNIFLILGFVGLAFAYPISVEQISTGQKLSLSGTIELILWIGVTTFSFVTFDRLKKLKNFDTSKAKLNEQISELENKLESLKNKV